MCVVLIKIRASGDQNRKKIRLCLQIYCICKYAANQLCILNLWNANMKPSIFEIMK